MHLNRTHPDMQCGYQKLMGIPESYFSEDSAGREPQRPSCSIQRITYEGIFSMATLDFTPQRKTIASRSTKVTFDMSNAIFKVSGPEGFKAFSSSATYSPVNWPHNR